MRRVQALIKRVSEGFYRLATLGEQKHVLETFCDLLDAGRSDPRYDLISLDHFGFNDLLGSFDHGDSPDERFDL